MRLICPTCSSQYEIADDAISGDGLDVQCSQCNEVWFFVNPTSELSKRASATADVEEPQAPSDEFEQPEPRALDPAVSKILREEAELEARRRAEEAVSTQSLEIDEPAEFASDESEADSPENDTTLAAATVAAQIVDTAPASDVSAQADEPTDAIATDHSYQDAAPTKRWSGIWIGLLIGALLSALHWFAPQISEQVPAASSAIESYTDTFDDAGATLRFYLQRALDWLNGRNQG